MLVGKWHLGVGSPPLKSGFDHFYGFLDPEVDYYPHTSRRGDVDWQRNGADSRRGLLDASTCRRSRAFDRRLVISR